MAGLVNELRGNQRHTHNNCPLDAVHPVSLLIGHTTCRLIDMRLEEAHHRSHEVPRQVDACQETHGLHGHLIGKQQLDILYQSALLLLCLLGRKLSTLL